MFLPGRFLRLQPRYTYMHVRPRTHPASLTVQDAQPNIQPIMAAAVVSDPNGPTESNRSLLEVNSFAVHGMQLLT
jgi:hypothetical protein